MNSSFPRTAARWLWHRIPRVARNQFWALLARRDNDETYQGIIYQDRVLRSGRNRAIAYHQLFPTPPIGQSILDAGCNAGYYCFMAAGQGAAYCRGIDVNPRLVAESQALACTNGITNVEFVCGDVLTYEIERDFDVILCLNLLHHLRNIENVEGALDRLYEHARDRLVLIVSTPETPGRSYVYDTKRGTRTTPKVRIGPEFFYARYGRGVRITRAHTYGAHRMVVVIPAANRRAA